jgi:hypothetical protein
MPSQDGGANLPALAGAAGRRGDPAHIETRAAFENIEIFDFELSEEEMQQISAMGSAGGRLTDFGFAPKWD